MVSRRIRAISWMLCGVILLAGCEGTEMESSQEETAVSHVEEVSMPDSVIEESQPVTSEENYLADEHFDTEEPLEQYDVETQYAYTGMDMCETEDAYYGRDLLSEFYMYWDKQSGVSGKLCGKPECAHEDASCNAYVGPSDSGLTVYEGYLYWTGVDRSNFSGTDRYLWRMNLDGTQQEKMQKLEEKEVNRDSLVQIHRGYIYTAGIYTTVEDGVSQEGIRIIAEPIGVETEPVVVMDETYMDVMLYYTMRVTGNHIYVLVEKTPLVDEGTYQLKLYRWDSKTRQMENLLDLEKSDFSIADMQIGEDGTVYFAGKSEGVPGVYRYDFQTESLETVFQWEEESDAWTRLTKTHVIALYHENGNPRSIQVRTLDGEIVCEREMMWEGRAEDASYFPIFCGGNDQYVIYNVTYMDDRVMIRVPLNEEEEIRVLWRYEL